MTSKNICSVCKHNGVSIGHLCPDCFSPKLVQFNADTGKRYVAMPVFSNIVDNNNEYTPTDPDELLPIPELVEDPLLEHSEDVDEVSQSETGALIADIEATLRKIGGDDEHVSISPSKIRKKIHLKQRSESKLIQFSQRSNSSRVSKLLKKKEDQASLQPAKEEANAEQNNPQLVENNIEAHKNKVFQKRTARLAVKSEISAHELKRLSKINIKKQLKELEEAIQNFDIENVVETTDSVIERSEIYEYPELIVDDDVMVEDEQNVFEEKWERIKDIRVTAVKVEERIEKNYHKNKLPLKLAEYEQGVSLMLGVENFYKLPISWRLKARFKAFNDARVLLTEEQANKVRHITLLEHKNEEYQKKKPGLRDLEMIKDGNWKWFALTSVVHTVFIIMLWSVILIEKMPEDPDRVSYFDSFFMSDDVENTAVDLQPNKKDKPDDPMDAEAKFDPEFKRYDDVKKPEIPGLDINPSLLNSKEDKKIESERPSITDTQDFGISISSKGGSKEGGEGFKESLAGHRTGTGKETLLAKHGGTEKTVNAVKLALKWLASQQNEDGSWYAKDSPATGKAHPEGYTALALLCFLGDGNTEYYGEYKNTVKKGVEFLLHKQRVYQTGVISSTVSGLLYNHSISTLALSEYYGLTKRKDLVTPLKRALKFLYNSQQASGGWDYTSNKLQNRTDMSITGWVVMAYHSVMASGLPIKRESWEAAYKGVRELIKEDGSAYYSLNGNVYPGRRGLAMTAVSVLCRLYARVPTTDRLMGKSLRWLKSNLPNSKKLRSTNSSWGRIDYRKLKNDDDFFHTTYYWYYGTLSMFMVTNGVGKDWSSWNKAMQRAILSYQITKNNDYKGSWDPVDSFWGEIGGRLYATCLNILNLEIYYRYLPLYSTEEHMLRFESNNDDDDEKASYPEKDNSDDILIHSVEEAARIVNDATKSDADKIIAITYLKINKSDEALNALSNILWNEKVSEMIRWRVVGMLSEFPTRDSIVGVLMDAFDIDFNENLQEDILNSLAKLKRKDSLLFVARKLDTSEDEKIRAAALKALESITSSRFGMSKSLWIIWINSNFK